MSFASSTSNNRLVGVIGAVLVQAALLYALLVGLAVHMPTRVGEDLKLFATAPPPPPPPPHEKTTPHRIRSKRPEGAASPPNLRAKRTEVVAPPPVVILPAPPPPVVVAPLAGIGSADHAGASTVPGPGSGSGGIGNGTGSGDEGSGDGDGGDDIPPRLRKGRLKDSDYPRAAGDAGIGGTVSVRYAVETDGRVTGCTVTRSSGNAALDETTCRLIEQRFRYAPSRDAHGRPVRSFIVENHSWEVHRDDAADSPD